MQFRVAALPLTRDLFAKPQKQTDRQWTLHRGMVISSDYLNEGAEITDVKMTNLKIADLRMAN